MTKQREKIFFLLAMCCLLAGCSSVTAERQQNMALLREYEQAPKDKLLISVDSAQDADLRNVQCLFLIHSKTNAEINMETYEDSLPFAKVLDLAPQLKAIRQGRTDQPVATVVSGEELGQAIRITVGLSCRAHLKYKEIKQLEGVTGRVLFNGEEISTISSGQPYSLITIQ